MLIPISRFIGTPVLSLQTGMPLARISEPIVDPRSLRVVAFRVIGSRLSHAESVLHSEDIRDFTELGAIVDGDDSLMPLDDLVRLQEILSFDFSLIGLAVETKSRHKLGTVASFGINLDIYDIMQIYVQPPLLKSLATSGVTINRSQIVSVNSKKLTVKDATIKQPKTTPAAKTTKPFVNPFRAQPQPKPSSTQHA